MTMTRREIRQQYVIADVNNRLKQIVKEYEETGDAEAMHQGIKGILYGPKKG
ncbi:hypothetical protein MKY95_07465 [Paenibacillus sp. FSL P4-0176]|uniref:hypothetical protein n=1 Tax=Paenibacillus sp. FSL P4-0176 TaxID=2921631 RepID=UPI0030CC5898